MEPRNWNRLLTAAGTLDYLRLPANLSLAASLEKLQTPNRARKESPKFLRIRDHPSTGGLMENALKPLRLGALTHLAIRPNKGTQPCAFLEIEAGRSYENVRVQADGSVLIIFLELNLHQPCAVLPKYNENGLISSNEINNIISIDTVYIHAIVTAQCKERP